MKHIPRLKTQYGFTIVELLIVIVVIGILAAISIVSYNGIQDRASNASKTSAITSAIKTVELYKAASNDILPWMPSGTPGEVCIGGVDDYPAEGVFEAGECVVFTEGTSRWSIRVSSDFNNSINNMLGYNSYPSGNFIPVKIVRGNVTENSRGVIAADFGYGFSLYFSTDSSSDSVVCPNGAKENNRCTIWINGASIVKPLQPH